MNDSVKTPRNVEGLSNAGMVCRQAGRTGDAIGTLNRAIEIEPNDPQANDQLGLAYIDDGNRQMAETQLAALRTIAANTGFSGASNDANKLDQALHR